MKFPSSGLISACLSLLVGLLTGAAVQRWGSGEKATHHHTQMGDT